MEKTLKLRVPIIADVEIGPSWGTLEDYNDKEWSKYA